jgi:hypothetical protein
LVTAEGRRDAERQLQGKGRCDAVIRAIANDHTVVIDACRFLKDPPGVGSSQQAVQVDHRAGLPQKGVGTAVVAAGVRIPDNLPGVVNRQGFAEANPRQYAEVNC